MIRLGPRVVGPGEKAIAHVPEASRMRDGSHPRVAVFLDRDGVLVEDVHHLRRPDDLRLLPGVTDALRTLAPRFALVVVTNQSGIARGYFDENDLLAIHVRLLEALAAEGAFVDALYACPHLDGPGLDGPDLDGADLDGPGCDCRKPAPGMLQRAAHEHGLALDRSFLIGDAPRDVEAGRRAGVRSLLLAPKAAPWSEALRWIG